MFFPVLWTLEDTKKVVYIFYFRPNNVLLSWQYMTMCSNILFLPEFLSTSFLQICKPDLHQIWSRGVLCALEDPKQNSPRSAHRWRYSNKFKKKKLDKKLVNSHEFAFWICCCSATYGLIPVKILWGLLEQGSPNTGPRTGTGPWTSWYRSAATLWPRPGTNGRTTADRL